MKVAHWTHLYSTKKLGRGSGEAKNILYVLYHPTQFIILNSRKERDEQKYWEEIKTCQNSLQLSTSGWVKWLNNSMNVNWAKSALSQSGKSQVVKGNCSPSEWRALRFLSLSVILAVRFSYIHLNWLRIFLSFLTCKNFLSWILIAFFLHLLRKLLSFSSVNLLIWWITLFCFQIINLPCIPGENPNWSRYIIISYILLNSICQYVIVIF